jgi:hypothetical protein
LLSAYTLVESLHEVLKVWEQVRVGKMLVRGDQLAIYPHIELAMLTRDKGECRDALAHPGQRVARHPGGPERVASILAVFDLYV